MYKLQIDYTKCKGCFTCEVLLPTFRTVHGGVLLISKNKSIDEEANAAIELVRGGCPNDAIIFNKMSEAI